MWRSFPATSFGQRVTPRLFIPHTRDPASMSQVAARRTRFGRALKAPVRYEPEEMPLDDRSDCEPEDCEDLCTSSAAESSSGDDDEDSSLDGFIVKDDEVEDGPEAQSRFESSDEDDIEDEEADDTDRDFDDLVQDVDMDT